MALEPITRQEQIIAGKDLEPITRMERFLYDYGVSKYFGEEKAFEPIVWDASKEYETVGIKFGSGEIRIYSRVGNFFNATVDMFDTMSIVMGGEPASVPPSAFGEVHQYEHGWEFAEGMVYASDGQQTFLDTVLPEGVWVHLPDGATSFSLTPFTTVKTLDEKYMPTLTSPSGKKFKMSVDDSGVLSATEV